MERFTIYVKQLVSIYTGTLLPTEGEYPHVVKTGQKIIQISGSRKHMSKYIQITF